LNHERRRAAVEVTVERVNAERAAIGLPAGVKVGFNADGVPYLALVEDAPRKIVRERVPMPVVKPAAPSKIVRERF
jgi:hypothetical protein